MGGERDRNIRLFVDADGRLTELLAQLKIETIKVREVRDPTGKARGFAFVEMSDTASNPFQAISELQEEPAAAVPAKASRVGSPNEREPASGRQTRRVRRNEVSARLLAHAVEIFGSEETARKWL